MAKYYSVDKCGVYYVSSTRKNTPQNIKAKHPEILRECECGRDIYCVDGDKILKIEYNWLSDRVEIIEKKNKWVVFLLSEITKRKTKNFYPTKQEFRRYLSKNNK